MLAESMQVCVHDSPAPSQEMLTFLNACQIGLVNVINDHISQVNVNGLSKYGQTPLYLAVSHNRLKVVEILLMNGADPNQLIKNKLSALHTAAEKEYSDILNLLLNNGGNPNLANDKYETPLHKAAYYGRAESIIALLCKGADPNFLNSSSQTPLQLAAYGCPTEVRPLAQNFKKTIKYLLMAGGDPLLQDIKGDSFFSIVYKEQPKLDVEAIINKLNIQRQLVFRPIRQILKNQGFEVGSQEKMEIFDCQNDVEKKATKIMGL